MALNLLQSGTANAAPDDNQTVADLVTANRILFDQGVVDGFGHVSVRDVARPGHMLISRSMAPGLVTGADILRVDIATCEPVETGNKTYLERFIHCEIYKMRDDVNAVVHSHSPSVIPFGLINTPLKPVYHMSGFLGEGAPVFEIRQSAGPETDMLVRNPALGAALAGQLGDRSVVLMRGHGSTVVGNSLRQAVFHAVYAEVNARLQADAMKLGEVIYLNPAEAANAARTNDGQAGRAWELWKLRAMGSGAGN
ncbi:class II aldolase/adducin family protein [Xanthobacter sp. TB0136]|uniref:class II aldolase/adducin family protein n=1 Tax=Xanthobacter sp. TB0136 TaxID=3459177 RepID=UPI0040390B4A